MPVPLDAGAVDRIDGPERNQDRVVDPSRGIVRPTFVEVASGGSI
jgi:hypothetical protein